MSSKHLLLVGDLPSLLDRISVCTTNHDVKVSLAPDCAFADCLFRRRHLDIIFIACDEPDADSNRLIRSVRNVQINRGERPSRIISVRSRHDKDSVLACILAGFDMCLGPDCSPSELLELIVNTHETILTRMASFQLEEGIVCVPEELLDIIPEFIETRLQLLDSMHPALESLNTNEVRRIAHNLKGSFHLYGFLWAAAESERIERRSVNLRTEQAQLHATAQGIRQHLLEVSVFPMCLAPTHPYKRQAHELQTTDIAR